MTTTTAIAAQPVETVCDECAGDGQLAYDLEAAMWVPRSATADWAADDCIGISVLDCLCCDGGCRGHVDCSDPLFGRRLGAGAAPQGRGEVEPVRVAGGAYHGRLGRVDQEGPATG